MKSETLQLLGTMDEAVAMSVGRILQTIEGVSKVAIVTTSSSIQIDFNEEFTSASELRTALERAGFGLKRGHGGGNVCCGSCGG